MASRFRRSALAVNTEASGLGALLNGGTLEIYDGDQPASIATAITTQVLLARLTFGDPAFKAPVDGSITAVPITDDPNAAATGRARFFIARTSTGRDRVRRVSGRRGRRPATARSFRSTSSKARA
jgi:hypothetical protein